MTAYSDKLPGWFAKESGANHEGDGPTTRATSTTGGDLDQEPVVVWQAANPMEAQIVKGRLESEGIPALVRGEVLSTIYGLTTGSLAATDVLVPAPLAAKAIELLSENVNEEIEWEDSEQTDDLA
ncbi:hypothetical protein BH10CHL1_BH10CHL1_20900 [soil metagenome]